MMEPPPDYVVVSGSLPPGAPSDFYARVARIGKEKGTKAIVDVSGKALKEALEEVCVVGRLPSGCMEA